MQKGRRPLTNIALSSTVRISDDAIFREIDGEAIVLDLASGMYFGLNTVGTRTWQLIQELGTLEAVRRALVTEFDVDDATAGRDLTALVAELAARTLVHVE